MKKISVLLFFMLIFIFPNRIYANGAGLPAFFKINDKYAISNPLQAFGITASSFLIPQDFAPENYIVNHPIHFQVDETQLQTVIPQDFLKKTKFSWDFGDGTKADDLENSHTYTKIGSYILVLTINVYEADTSQAPTQFIDSFLMNILPENGNYTLPQAVIKVNKQQVIDPLNKPINIDYNKPITFDASSSTADGKIIDYIWNFGDGQTSTKPIVTHTYTNQYSNIVVLRVKDTNGFISDAFVGLTNSTDYKKSSISSQNQNYLFDALLALPFLVLIGIGIRLLKKK